MHETEPYGNLSDQATALFMGIDMFGRLKARLVKMKAP